MTINRLATMMVGAALACTAVWASDTQSHMAKLSDEARRARIEAQEISTLLKQKKPDMAKVQEKMQLLTAHANALTDHLNAFEAENQNLTSRQAADLEKLRTAVQLVNIFVTSKADRLATGNLQKDRTLLRAKAEGIAKRAEFVEQSLAKMRS